MKLGIRCTTAVLVAGAAHALEPCAQVADLFQESQKSNSTFLIPGELVHRCLQSIPIEVPEAVSFVDEFRKLLQFQSTLENLKDPPPDYLGSPVDLMSGLDTIQKKARQNQYSSQFEFDSELLHLLGSANDGHLKIEPCSTKAFSFSHGQPLVSISQDGLKLPEVYTFGDAKLLAQGGDVSPVKFINGTDAAEYLEKFSADQEQQDPDARYNTLFPSLSRTSVPKGLWMKTSWWPGPSFHFEFKNGTRRNFETLATSDWEVLNERNGTAMYDRTCRQASSNLSKRSMMYNSQADQVGYPNGAMRGNNSVASGYFSSQPALRDAAILSVPNFNDFPSELSPFVKGFLRNATEQGKKKLIIDLSGNSGGNILSSFALFAEIFPGKEMYLGGRFRAHESADFMGRVSSHMKDSKSIEEQVQQGNPFIYQKQVTPDQKNNFRSWKDLYGPHEILGANMSSLMGEFNLTEVSSPKESRINGYGPTPLDPKTPAFAPDDITIVTDGFCASTCTTFVAFMRDQGIRSIAFGGRPRNEPMQAMGGVKGAQSADIRALSTFFGAAQQVIARSMGTQSPVLSYDEWKRFNETAPPDSSYQLSLQVYTAGINLRNAYGRNDDTTPLQFVYQAAECRRFLTLDNYLHQESVWNAAAEAMFWGGNCVKGSTNGKGSLDAAQDSS